MNKTSTEDCTEDSTEVSTEVSTYENYCKVNKSSEELAFQKLFEFDNVRSFSEAICETIGSMMSIAVSNGRNIMPYNLDKEVCLKFNLPPLHVLNEKFIPEIAKQWREYGKRKNFFKSHPQKSLFKDQSSSLENHRKREEKKSFTPPEFFLKNFE